MKVMAHLLAYSVALVFVGACGSNASVRNDTDSLASPTPQITSTRAGGADLWDLHQGDSIESMASTYPYVFIADVDSVQTRQQSAVPPGTTLDINKHGGDKPNITSLPMETISMFRLTIRQPLSPAAPAAGVTVDLINWGGDVVVAPNKIERLEYEGDVLPQVGERYLIFATEYSPVDGTLTAPPWGKLLIENDTIVGAPAWKDLPVVAGLSGRRVSEVIDDILTSLDSAFTED